MYTTSEHLQCRPWDGAGMKALTHNPGATTHNCTQIWASRVSPWNVKRGNR